MPAVRKRRLPFKPTPTTRKWYRAWYGVANIPARVTIAPGRVKCAVLGLPWLAITHTDPQIIVFRARLGLPPLDIAFELVGGGGQRILVCPWRVELLRERLIAAGFTLTERPRWIGPWL